MMSSNAGNLQDDPIPASVLLRMLRDVWNPLEVKVVLTVAMLGGLTRPVSEHEALAQETLRHGARGDGSDRPFEERILDALEMATTRGLVLRLVDDEDNYWLVLGTDENRARVRAANLGFANRPDSWRTSLRLERPSIFTLYEQNIGLVTPIIADRLIEALERYPETWISDAINEAVNYNRRNWRYIQRILENWLTDGRTDEDNRGDLPRSLVREKHLRGKYAHLFGRDDVPDL